MRAWIDSKLFRWGVVLLLAANFSTLAQIGKPIANAVLQSVFYKMQQVGRSQNVPTNLDDSGYLER